MNSQFRSRTTSRKVFLIPELTDILFVMINWLNKERRWSHFDDEIEFSGQAILSDRTDLEAELFILFCFFL